MPSRTTPHMPGTTASSSPFIMWQVDVPMTATIRPESVTPAAGTVTCASTLPTATAIPAGRPVHSAACSVRSPARSPSALSGPSMRVATKSAKSGFSARRKSSDGQWSSWRIAL